ncbi:hypothetical protein HK102_010789, partial [Quaeritorhiza haematococci]
IVEVHNQTGQLQPQDSLCITRCTDGQWCGGAGPTSVVEPRWNAFMLSNNDAKPLETPALAADINAPEDTAATMQRMRVGLIVAAVVVAMLLATVVFLWCLNHHNALQKWDRRRMRKRAQLKSRDREIQASRTPLSAGIDTPRWSFSRPSNNSRGGGGIDERQQGTTTGIFSSFRAKLSSFRFSSSKVPTSPPPQARPLPEDCIAPAIDYEPQQQIGYTTGSSDNAYGTSMIGDLTFQSDASFESVTSETIMIEAQLWEGPKPPPPRRNKSTKKASVGTAVPVVDGLGTMERG